MERTLIITILGTVVAFGVYVFAYDYWSYMDVQDNFMEHEKFDEPYGQEYCLPMTNWNEDQSSDQSFIDISERRFGCR